MEENVLNSDEIIQINNENELNPAQNYVDERYYWLKIAENRPKSAEKVNKIRVLSLFDGISCGMIALERAGIQVEQYVAYEIEPNAIKISQKNYPQIIHCGDVTTADFTTYKGFDIVIGGSPCTN